LGQNFLDAASLACCACVWLQELQNEPSNWRRCTRYKPTV